jgi:hypothetical protein
MFHDFNYPAVLTAAHRAEWQLDDVMPCDATFDFSRPFLPEALAGTLGLSGLSSGERLILNQIRGHEYLSIFGLVEEFILPFLLDHVRSQDGSDHHRVRALLQFASEEAKHIHLFRRFQTAFTKGFAVPCAVIGPAEAIAAKILAHDPLSVALIILHVEWMTQIHYVDSVRDDSGLDPLFASLLRHHWMEEAQHAKLDTLIVETLAESGTRAGLEAAIDGYLEIVDFLDGGLKAQTELNLSAFEQATGYMLDAGSRTSFLTEQHQALRRTYLGSGMTHGRFLTTIDALSPAGRARIDAITPKFC